MTSTSLPVNAAAVSPLELQLSAATNQLGLNFMRNLPASATKDNVVLSPLSLQIILNLILLGAKDSSDTKAELLNVLGYDADSFKALTGAEKDDNKRRLLVHEAAHGVIRAIAESIAGAKELKYALANLMLTNTDVANPSSEYVAELKKYYDSAKVEILTQGGNKSDARPHEQINKWVEETTRGQITKLVGETDLPPLSEIALILLNAVSFQGKWLYQFKANWSTDEVFYNHGQENEAKKVKFMHQAEHFSYADLSAALVAEVISNDENSSKAAAEHNEWANKLNCRVLSMPFSPNEGQELDMIFVLPNKRDGLPEMLKQLSSSPRALAQIYRELEEESKVKVEVNLPKFTFETTHDAKSILTTMGLKQVFSDSAELNRMFKDVKGGPVKVNKLIHKARIAVDESGAEASAATVAVMSTRSMSWPPREPFTADRPFLFLLRHTRTGILLFAGSINAM